MVSRGPQGSDGVKPWSRHPRPTQGGTTCQWSHQTDGLDAPRPRPGMLTRPPPSGGRLLPSDAGESSSNDDWRQATGRVPRRQLAKLPRGHIVPSKEPASESRPDTGLIACSQKSRAKTILGKHLCYEREQSEVLRIVGIVGNEDDE